MDIRRGSKYGIIPRLHYMIRKLHGCNACDMFSLEADGLPILLHHVNIGTELRNLNSQTDALFVPVFTTKQPLCQAFNTHRCSSHHPDFLSIIC